MLPVDVDPFAFRPQFVDELHDDVRHPFDDRAVGRLYRTRIEVVGRVQDDSGRCYLEDPGEIRLVGVEIYVNAVSVETFPSMLCLTAVNAIMQVPR